MKPIFIFLCLFTTIGARAQGYWQQQVNTRIDVSLDDKKHFLYGYEEISYTNNSPDTLHYIYIHLWANAYKDDRTPFAEQEITNGNTDFYYSKTKQRGYIDSLQFNIDGQNVDYSFTERVPDIARIDLIKPLPPGQQIKITTPFRVKIPKVFSRMGHTKQAYFISQWFPKPAVYDRKGWHPISYLDQGEFYSDIGSYDVSITLPRNYIVMATGNCTDNAENEWLDSLSKLPLPKDTLYNHSWPKSAEEMKTIHFHEDLVHDFAWFADKRWIVRKDTVSGIGATGIVTAYTAFLPRHQAGWKKGTGYLKATVRSYGSKIGPYPYKTIKAVEGDMHAGGGMEYPTVTIIDKEAYSDLRTTIIHEAGHNWFYGMLATNERDHAWMDEGINTFYEQKTSTELSSPNTKLPQVLNDMESTLTNSVYYQIAAAHTDQAIDQTSANFTNLNYGMDVYYKSAMMLQWLEAYMGADNFEAGMHEYFNTWEHKHPYPEDMQAILQKHTDKNIDWFFNGALHTDKRVDFAIKDVKKEGNTTEVSLGNHSHMTAPVRVDAYANDSLLSSTWTQPFEHTASLTLPANTTGWTQLKIGNEIPDAKTVNNTYRRDGLFHTGGLKLSRMAGLNNSDKEKVFVGPAIGYNNYDHFELGLLIHNLTWPENRFRFALAPMYGFNSHSLIGTGSVGYVWHPEGIIKNICLQIDAKSFNYDMTNLNVDDPLFARFYKVAPFLEFTFKQHDALSTVNRKLLLKVYGIQEQYFDYKQDPVDSLYKPSVKNQQKVYGLLRYTHRNTRTLNPFDYNLEGQLGADFAKINLEGHLRIDYMAKNKAFYVRAFAGKFVEINAANADRYYLNSTYTGVNDYLYDDTYMGRNTRDGVASQQISIREGGFKVPTTLYLQPIGRSDNWLAALNMETDLPLGKIPLRLFLDVGTFADAGKLNPSGDKVIYDGGVSLHIYKDVIVVYYPFIMSSDLRDYTKSMYGKDAATKTIMFTLNLQNINWLNIGNDLLKFAH